MPVGRWVRFPNQDDTVTPLVERLFVPGALVRCIRPWDNRWRANGGLFTILDVNLPYIYVLPQSPSSGSYFFRFEVWDEGCKPLNEWPPITSRQPRYRNTGNTLIVKV